MDTLVVFARAPELGKVKTRLGARIGPTAALALHEAFVDDACALAAATVKRRVLAVAGEPSALADVAQRHGMILEQQGDGDLGKRMDAAIEAHVAYGPVCILGSDAPSLPAEMVRDAFHRLASQDFVLGPSMDGGYWLIGARVRAPELFERMEWSTPSVLPETLRRLSDRRASLLPFWYDVDEADDLTLLASHLDMLPMDQAPATRIALASVRWR